LVATSCSGASTPVLEAVLPRAKARPATRPSAAAAGPAAAAAAAKTRVLAAAALPPAAAAAAAKAVKAAAGAAPVRVLRGAQVLVVSLSFRVG